MEGYFLAEVASENIDLATWSAYNWVAWCCTSFPLEGSSFRSQV